MFFSENLPGQHTRKGNRTMMILNSFMHREVFSPCDSHDSQYLIMACNELLKVFVRGVALFDAFISWMSGNGL